MTRPLGTLPVSISFLLVFFGFGLIGHSVFAEKTAAQTAYRYDAPARSASAPEAQCEPDAAEQLPPPQPTAAQALQRGVLIVISIPSQRLFVFKDGTEWGSATVSTGRAGHGTPAGVFPILQKHLRHRSSTYYNAPMPYMQRLTWGGIALHAGRVTGRPASHGCIRLPWDFARRLYALTNPASTAVMIVRQPLLYADQARSIAGGGPLQSAPVRQARAAPLPYDLSSPAAPTGQAQTIQLAAAANAQGADMLWQELSQTEPELQALNPVIIPATVRSAQVFRLRATGQEAHAICSRLMARGVACIKVVT